MSSELRGGGGAGSRTREIHILKSSKTQDSTKRLTKKSCGVLHTHKVAHYTLSFNWIGIKQSSEKAMAPHSSTLAWKIPWTEEPAGLQSMGLLRVRHDWVTSLSLFTFMHWGRKWQPTPVFLPGESQGQGSLVGCRLWGHKESDMTSDLAAAAS